MDSFSCKTNVLFATIKHLMEFHFLGMGLDKRWVDKTSRPLPNSPGLCQRHDAAHANLRWQREPEMETPRGRFDSSRSHPCLSGLQISRATRNNRRKMRLQCRDSTVASLQPQSLTSKNSHKSEKVGIFDKTRAGKSLSFYDFHFSFCYSANFYENKFV